ncbi:MAG: hypothetical protein QOC82_249, partial [Frankiaceae bacterium]|nr:hypothetical protein [Frankiaceae bacterium]
MLSARRRTVSVITAITALVGGIGLIPSAALGSVSSDPGVSGGFVPAGPEVPEFRTRYGTTFAGATPGTYDSVIHAKPVHYLDANGAWQNIDPTLVPGTDGTFHNAADDLGITVKPVAVNGGELVHMNLGDGLSLGYALSGSAPITTAAPVGASITLPSIVTATNLRITSQAEGVKEDLVLTGALAPRTFVYPLYLNGLTASLDSDGNVIYRDLNGVERARTPHGSMVDSKIDPHSGDPAFSNGVTYQLISGGPTGSELKVSLDNAWLSDPTRQWPVTVDPTATTTTYHGGTDDTFVQYPYTNDYSTDVLLKSGTFDGGTDKARSFIHFAGINALDGKVINSATVKVFENWSFSCTAEPVNLYRVTQSWTGTGLHSYPGWSLGALIDQVTAAHGYTSCPTGAYVNFDATTAMKDWASNTWANDGVALVAPSETNDYEWKKWDSVQGTNDPEIVVNWEDPDTAPGRPAGRSVGGNTCSPCTDPITADTTPALTGNTTDADADTIEYFFEVYPGWLTSVDASGNASVSGVTASATGHTGYVASGTTGTWTTTPALADGKYSYRVRAYDSQLYGVWSAGWVNFTIDSTGPATSVSSSTHPSQSTWYSNNTPTVSWSASSESGIKGYSYVLDQVSSTVADTTAEGTATSTSYSGLADGIWYFHVRAQNNANIWGSTATYTLRIDTTAPSAPSGLTSDHTANLLSTNPTVNASWNAASDNASGVAGYSYVFNNSATTRADGTIDTTGTSVSSGALPDGTWWLHVETVDNAGNISGDSVIGPFLINAAIPAAPTITSSTSSTNWTTSRSVSFNWTAPSDTFGINGYSVAFDQNPSATLAHVITTTGLSDSRTNVADGIWYLHVAAVNQSGTWGATATYKVMIDGTTPLAPALSSATNPNTNAWYTSTSATVNATASAVSGITGYAIKLDQNSAGDPGLSITSASGTATYTGLANGVWYVHIRAISGSGLVSGISTYPLRIDAATPLAPSVTATIPANTWSATRTVTFNWTAPAAASGIAGYAEAFDQNANTTLPQSIGTLGLSDTRTNIPDGVWYLHLAAVNNAGTWTQTTTYKIMIDATVPVAPTLTSTSHPNQSTWYPATSGSVTASTSALSGIPGYAYSLDHNAAGDP